MKKLIYGSLFLAIVGVGIVSCTKEEIKATNNQSPEKVITDSFIEKSSFVNPFDHVGENLYSTLSYLENYSHDLVDPNVFCPIEYANSGVEDYSTKTKILNRIKQYAIDNSLPVLAEDEMSKIYEFDSSTSFEKLDSLVSSGAISSLCKDQILNFNINLQNAESTNQMIEISKATEIEISEIHSQLNEGERQMLYSIVSGVKYTAQYLIDNGNTSLPIEEIVNAMPCGGATGIYMASFVGLCLATNPIGWAVGIIGFAGGVYGVFDSC
jgi:hypothetical protein